MHLSSPIEPIAASYYDSFHRFPVIEYEDRDWNKYRKWRETVFDKLSKDEKAAMYKEEQSTGVPMDPANCRIKKTRQPNSYDVELYAVFSQSWGSTTLGFGGVGGQAITSAYTIVVECFGAFCVYFGGKFAYLVEKPTTKFFEDVASRQLRPVSSYKIYCQ